MAMEKPSHRGRVQAQGGHRGGIEESESWARYQPLPAVDGHDLLVTLHGKLNDTEQVLRAIAFVQAHSYIDNAAAAGGVNGPKKKSFPNRALRSTDPRVDVEVITGLAFVRS